MNYTFKWQCSTLQSVLASIVQIMEDNGAYFIEYTSTHKYFIVPNNDKVLIPKQYYHCLSKDWKKYSCEIRDKVTSKAFRVTIMTQAEYDEYIRQREELSQRLQREQEEKNIKQRELLEAIEGLAQEYGDKWRSWEWIRKNIGEYHTEEPMWQYFWTIIGDNWKVVDWKHNIQIEESVYKKIYNMKVNGYKGSTFLGRTFKNSKGYSTGITGSYKVEKKGKHYGVYGLFKSGQLMYIGSTIRDFEERKAEHEAALRTGQGRLYVHSLLDEIDMRVMIDCSELKVNKTLTIEDVESMELALIRVYQPVGNLAGRTEEFKYKGYSVTK